MKITCCGQVCGLFLSKEILLGSLAKLERIWAEYLITEGDFTLLKSYCSSAKELSHGAVSCREGHVQETVINAAWCLREPVHYTQAHRAQWPSPMSLPEHGFKESRATETTWGSKNRSQSLLETHSCSGPRCVASSKRRMWDHSMGNRCSDKNSSHRQCYKLD